MVGWASGNGGGLGVHLGIDATKRGVSRPWITSAKTVDHATVAWVNSMC